MEIINVRWSWWVRILTGFLSIFFLGAAYYWIQRYLENPEDYEFLFIFVALVFLLSVFVINAPMTVVLTPEAIEMRKLFGKIRIPYAHITFIGRYKPAYSDIRAFGSAGFWGYIGVIQSVNIGRYYAFAGNLKESFLIRTQSGKVYLFSCESPDTVVESIKRIIAN